RADLKHRRPELDGRARVVDDRVAARLDRAAEEDEPLRGEGAVVELVDEVERPIGGAEGTAVDLEAVARPAERHREGGRAHAPREESPEGQLEPARCGGHRPSRGGRLPPLYSGRGAAVNKNQPGSAPCEAGPATW